MKNKWSKSSKGETNQGRIQNIIFLPKKPKTQIKKEVVVVEGRKIFFVCLFVTTQALLKKVLKYKGNTFLSEEAT